MQITVFGCKIYISVLFPALLSLILFFDQSGVMLFGVAAVVLHELGHLIVMLLFHLLPDEIVLQPAGIQIKRNMNTLGSGKRLLIAFAGCGANLLVATGSYFNESIFAEFEERGFAKEVECRSSADGLLGENHQIGVPGLCLVDGIDDFGGIAVDITDRVI